MANVVERTELVLKVLKEKGFKSVINIHASDRDYEKPSIHVFDEAELSDFECEVFEHTKEYNRVTTEIDGVEVFTLVQVAESVA